MAAGTLYQVTWPRTPPWQLELCIHCPGGPRRVLGRSQEGPGESGKGSGKVLEGLRNILGGVLGKFWDGFWEGFWEGLGKVLGRVLGWVVGAVLGRVLGGS